jgi:uncharacterized membrane protein
VLRVHVPWVGFEQLLDSAFEQIRMYAKNDVAVSLRLLRALGDIGRSTRDGEIHRLLAERAKRVVDGCAERLGEDEMKGIRARHEAVGEVFSSGGAFSSAPPAD